MQVAVQNVDGTPVQSVWATLTQQAPPVITTNAVNATPVQIYSDMVYTVPIDTVVTVGEEIEVTLS